MSHSKLQVLPREIFCRICDFLDDVKPASVLSLALANKYCYAIAIHLLHRTICIDISGPSQLSQTVQSYEVGVTFLVHSDGKRGGDVHDMSS